MDSRTQQRGQLRTRRAVLQAMAAGSAIAIAPLPLLANAAGAQAVDGPYGPLQAADALGFRLPVGFTSRVVAQTGQTVANTGFTWHAAPDGGAAFGLTDGGWIYVSNAEISDALGGASMIRFDSNGAITDARTILSGTYRNCSGGPTPWGTWLSCEEIGTNGQVYECDPFGVNQAVARPQMGYFSHEAAAVDPDTSIVYMTEDRTDGGLYRYTPTQAGVLTSGALEVMTEVAGQIGWAPIPDPRGRPTETRFQVPTMKVFNRGEGAFFGGGRLVFATTGDDRVWAYTPGDTTLTVLYDPQTAANPVLNGADNVTIADIGDVFVSEDQGNLEVVVVPVEGGSFPFLRLEGQTGTELTGVAFDPSGSRLYFSSQRNPGTTYEISGPFRAPADPVPQAALLAGPVAIPGAVDAVPFTCSLDGNTLSWTNQGASEYFVRSVNGGVERFLGTVSGGAALQLAVTGNDEQYLVRHWLGGVRTDALCPGNSPEPNPGPQEFTCSLDGNTLSWTNEGAEEYYVRSVNGGVERYLGTVVAGSPLQLTVSGTDEQYLVRHWLDDVRTDAFCPGNSPDPTPGPQEFTCSLDNGVLSWNDQGASQYFIRSINGGTEAFIGATAGLSIAVTGTDEQYLVRHWTDGRADAICDGNPGDPAPGPEPFACSLNNGVLSWNDQGAQEYYIRSINGGVQQWLATVPGDATPLSVAVSGTDEQYMVRHWTNGRADAICDGNPPA